MQPIVIIVLVTLSLHSSVAKVVKSGELPIRFPEAPITVADNDVPDECKDLTYCTIKPAGYSEDKYKHIFKDYKPMPQPQLVGEIGNRFADDEDENCKSEVTYKPIYQARQRRDQPWRDVVQAPGHDYVQSVRLEQCSNLGARCLATTCAAPGFTATCEQTYSTWELLVAKGDNETEKITTELPVCCSCRSQPVAFMNRFGKP